MLQQRTVLLKWEVTLQLRSCLRLSIMVIAGCVLMGFLHNTL